MKKQTLLSLLLGLSLTAFAQKTSAPEFAITQAEVEVPLRFLASDELGGRRTGSNGNLIAARYIAEHLRTYGYQPAPGLNGYFQPIGFQASTPPATASLMIGKTNYQFKEDFIIMTGDAATLNKVEVVFAGHGWIDEKTGQDDYKGKDVKGKLVVVLPGPPNESAPQAVFRAMGQKRDWAYERGAVGLIELYRLSFPWNFFTSYFGKESLGLAPKEGPKASNKMIYGWMKEKTDISDIKDLQAGKKFKANLASSGFSRRMVPSQNVVGILEGSDPELKNEYLILSAHYDHVGIGKEGGGAYSKEDSIFNGARDNAMGTVALLSAAKALAQQRPKRSIILLAVTGEELGLLGSQYYSENPLIPLKQCIFNLNTDGAGYNSTEHISIIGWSRTGTDALVEEAANRVNLKVFPEPAPEQNLFDRSDNVSFASKGVPALNYSPGLTKFDDVIAKYYHQVADQAESVDMPYFLKYCQSFANLARLIADNAQRPQWKAGDKYEKAGAELYKK
ncbi:M28 family peptidase [Haliscomenobacter hydrossis]|uniref:Peptidase M28 n=1 Tax=Haliscomenobacter hydrossis (strain ATCC 27775 / DSM 1100 / LMG 10767 / O) TaxID=760192 RepID=F4KSV5_HALH1|nr:M28 family peptidase [Haliscomenobacter hydrossis]AEE49062.1 peptidase M28 [Haliscomenobacter hydrossis DSM 1100]